MTIANSVKSSWFSFLLAITTVLVALICNGCSDPINRERSADSVVRRQEPAGGQTNDDTRKTMPAQQTTDTTGIRSADDSSGDAQIVHGKYLVHHVAQCIQCHTPRDQTGKLIESRSMTGAAIPVSGPGTHPPWATKSVSLAGLGNYNESFVRHLLTHGVRPDGTSPKNPMPSFQLSQSDADAVVAYLCSL